MELRGLAKLLVPRSKLYMEAINYPAGKITRVLRGIPGDDGYLEEGNPCGNFGCK